jgi:Zn-dependent protease with chaperone function
MLALLVTTYTLPPEKLAKAIEYARARNRLYFVAVAYGIAVLIALIYWNAGPRLRERLRHPLVYGVVLLLGIDLLELPIGMRYHWLAVKYEQSIQPWGPWLLDWVKGEAIGLAVSGLLVWGFFWLVGRCPGRWWLYAWLTSIPLLVFGIFVYPLAIDPLFYQFTPLDRSHPQIVSEIERVTARGGLEIPRDRMFEMNASSKLKSVNAYVTGIGASKRVVVWDNTLRVMTPGQTLFVFGHEMGHYVLHHIWNAIALSSLGALVLLFGTWKWMPRVSDLGSLPALLLVMALFDFVSTPVVNGVTRMQEHNADIYGLEVIHGIVPDAPQAAAQAFQILGEISLADPSPSPFIEFWLYSHPSVTSRVRFAAEYDPWSKGQARQYVP